jgi:hypothetical protein
VRLSCAFQSNLLVTVATGNMGRCLVGAMLLSSLLFSVASCAQISNNQAIKDGPAAAGASPSPPVWPASFEVC